MEFPSNTEQRYCVLLYEWMDSANQSPRMARDCRLIFFNGARSPEGALLYYTADVISSLEQHNSDRRQGQIPMSQRSRIHVQSVIHIIKQLLVSTSFNMRG